jgi:hypothetical protein
LGSTVTGDALFIAATAAAARTTLGATTVGGNLFTAVDAPSALSIVGGISGASTVSISGVWTLTNNNALGALDTGATRRFVCYLNSSNQMVFGDTAYGNHYNSSTHQFNTSGGTARVLIDSNGQIRYGFDLAATDQRAVGYLGTYPRQSSGNYTLALTDAGRRMNHTGTLTCTIPANSSVAFPIGTRIFFMSSFGVTTTITGAGGVTIYRWDGSGSTGNRTLSSARAAYIEKTNTDDWIAVDWTG